MLTLIKKQPGIRPSGLNRLLHRDHSAGLRNTLVRRGLVRKQRRGAVVRYYPLTPVESRREDK